MMNGATFVNATKSASAKFPDSSQDPWMPVITLTGDFTVKPGWHLGPRTLDAYEIVYFPYSTASEYRASGQSYVLSAPCVTITRPDEEHECRFDPGRPVRHLFVVFQLKAEEAAQLFAEFLADRTHILLDPKSPVPTLYKHLLYLSNQRTQRWKARCAALLYSILEELREASSVSDSGSGSIPVHSSSPDAGGRLLPLPLQQALAYMESHLFENISVADLAGRTGWSPAYFSKMFSRTLGCSPKRYVNQLRMEHASMLLLQETISIKEIAGRLRYENEHYFSRLFKQLKGVSPTVYREQFADLRFQHIVVSNEQEGAYPANQYFYFT